MANFGELINQKKPVLVDFSATWCGPCKMMEPILKQVKEEMGDQVSIFKIDVDKNNSLAAQYQVQGVPTLMIFKDGQLKWRQSGVIQANQIKLEIQKHGK